MLLPQMVGGLLQEKPKVPEFNKIDPSAEAGKAIGGNLTNFADASKLAGMTNQFNQDQLLAMLRKAIPNYDKLMADGSNLLGQSNAVIQSMLKGQLPKDVIDQIGRNSAEQSLAGGYAGSGMARNLNARDLGLNSLQLTGKGLDATSRWLSDAQQWNASGAVPNLMNVASMFISPAEQIRTQMWNTEGQFNRDWVSNQLDAEYSLGTTVGRAIIKTDDQIMQIISSFAGSMGGAMMG